MPYPHTLIPLGGHRLSLQIGEDVAWIDDDGIGLDSVAGLTQAQADALEADARRWILLGPEEAVEWFSDALARVRQARPRLLAAE